MTEIKDFERPVPLAARRTLETLIASLHNTLFYPKGHDDMYPLKLTPAFKDYLWGGTRLKIDFHKQTPLKKVAESWELSCHKDGNSIISNGRYKGMPLAEYVKQEGDAVLGTDCQQFEYFPILIKLIDAYDNLSVQVHPNNAYALEHEGEYGKTEMWYIVDCEPGASLLYGFQHEISKEEFESRIRNNTLLEVTNSVPVHKGDVFFIEAGTLHAIGKGILIAEIQQNSNTTYRIYDYGRVGVDGKPRQLHIDKALEVTDLKPPAREPKPQGDTVQKNGYSQTLLASCEYFTVSAVHVDQSVQLEADETSFHSLLILDGEAEIVWQNKKLPGEMSLTVTKGDSIFIPAGMGTYTVNGKVSLLFTKI